MNPNALISISEAAGLLGVSTATLRLWDRHGRLKAVRNAENGYRRYRLQEVLTLQKQTSLFPIEEAFPARPTSEQQPRALNASELRRLVRGLHRTLRDCEGNSNLIERFDELTKLLYCKALSERNCDPESRSPFLIGFDERDAPVAARIRDLLSQLVGEKPDLFPARFAAFRASDSTLRRLVEVLSPSTLISANEDFKGMAYEEVIKNTFDKGDNQQFFTPRAVVEFAVQMLDWSNSGLVCDPACGTGGFLLFVDRHLKQLGKKAEFLGFEIDERLAWVARINMSVHEAASFDIRHVPGAGSLGPALGGYAGKIDAIVTNPPFGSDLADQAALAQFELGRGRSTRRRGVLFIERCLSLLKPGGVLAIIIDDGVLNSPSNADTRRLILEHADPLAVVSLPETAFMPYASVKTSLLVLRKKGRQKLNARPTFFAQTEVVGRKPNGDPLFRTNSATNRLELDSDLPDILRTCAAFNSRGAKAVTSSEKVFLAPVPPSDATAFAKDGHRLDSAYHHPSRPEAVRALRSSPYPMRPLLELCAVRNEAVVPSKDLQDEELTYVGLANVEAYTGCCSPSIVSGASLKSSVKRFVAGDILYAKMRPELRKVCLIPDEIDEGFASAECLVLVPRTDEQTKQPIMLPELLSILLRSDLVYGQIIHLIIGIGRPRLNKDAILNVRLPCPPVREQHRLLELYHRSERASQELLSDSHRTAERARDLIAEARKTLVDDLLNPDRRA